MEDLWVFRKPVFYQTAGKEKCSGLPEKMGSLSSTADFHSSIQDGYIGYTLDMRMRHGFVQSQDVRERLPLAEKFV